VSREALSFDIVSREALSFDERSVGCALLASLIL
jgi:hypothetical protein